MAEIRSESFQSAQCHGVTAAFPAAAHVVGQDREAGSVQEFHVR